MRVLAILGGLAVATIAGAASAHHSLAAYDQSRQVALNGVVLQFHYTQPHPFLVIDVDGRPWKLEMDNLWELDQVGFSRDTFKPKDIVSVSGSPDRSGQHAMYLRRLDRPKDGLRYEQVGSSPVLNLRAR